MSRTALKSTPTTESTNETEASKVSPAARREWAVQWATERALTGDVPTVRDLQDSVRAHFKRGLGTDRACEIVTQAGKAAQQRQERHRAPVETTPVAAIAPVAGPQEKPAVKTMGLIVEAMRQWGVKRIELREDGSLNLIAD